MPGFIDSWDSGQPGANWDTGLEWDVTVGPPPGDVMPYINLITSEYRDRPRLIGTLGNLLQPLADNIVISNGMRTLFDLDTAVGQQLDFVGQWIGVSRVLDIPLNNVWFSWNVVGLGWNEGSWRNPNDPANQAITLPDDAYRTLLRARVVNNEWDGTIPGAYAVWDTMFAGTGFFIQITDNHDMTMVFTLRGPQPDAITLALLTNGLLSTVPAGVSATYVYGGP